MKTQTQRHRVARPASASLAMVLCAALLAVCLPLAPAAPTAATSMAGGEEQKVALNAAARTDFARLPLRFELNTGQEPAGVRFTARSREGVARLTANDVAFLVRNRRPATRNASPDVETAEVRLRPVGANPNPRVIGMDELPGKSHYFIGDDPASWRRNVPSYSKVKYESIYPGIDLIYYGNEEGRLEYDYFLAPGASPDQIAVAIEGAEGVAVNRAGDLLLQTSAGEVRQPAPRIYQESDGVRRVVAGGYVMRSDREVGFELAEYDASKPLVIDPQLVYATYLGGAGFETGWDIAAGPDGSAYVAGRIFVDGAGTSTFVTKLSADGSSVLYNAILGKSFGKAIAIDSTGAAYVVGGAFQGFPTKNAIQADVRGGTDAFVAKLTPDGSDLVYSTYLGGSPAGISEGTEEAADIELDATGVAYVTGMTNASANDFPLMNPTQATFGGGNKDGFLSVISANGSSLLFSTYVGRIGDDRVGREGDDEISSIAMNPQNDDVYLGGVTFFPNNPDAEDVPFMSYIKRIDAAAQWTALDDGQTRRYEHGATKAPVAAGLAIAAGVNLAVRLLMKKRPTPRAQISRDDSSANSDEDEIVAIVGGACLRTSPGATCSASAVLLTLDLNLDPKSATNLGDFTARSGFTLSAITGDSRGAVYISGGTSSRDLPTVNPIQSANGGGEDAFIAVLAAESLQVVFATYLGGDRRDRALGIATDAQGDIYVAGVTASANFPTTPGALQANFGGQDDAFIAKIGGVSVPTGPDFALGFSSSTIHANRRSKANIVVNINRIGGFGGNVIITPPTGLAKGLKLPRAPVTTGEASVKFKLKVKGNAPVGPQQLTFTGRDDAGRTRSATVTLIQ